MKRTLMTVILVALSGLCVYADQTTTTSTAPSVYTAAPPARFGVGIIVGEPTGASLKYWLNNTMAVDGALGWSDHDHADFYVHGDLLWHDFDLIPVSRGRLPVYFGVGGLVRVRDDNFDNQVGIRAPVGLSYTFENIPVDAFVEVAPAIDVAPSIHGEVTGGVGVRYWF